MKPVVLRLPFWIPTDRPWLVISARTCGSFETWEDAYHHAARIA